MLNFITQTSLALLALSSYIALPIHVFKSLLLNTYLLIIHNSKKAEI